MVSIRSRRTVIVVASVAILVIAIVVGWQIFGGANQADVRQRPMADTTSASVQPKTLQSHYIRLQYPADYRLHPQGDKGSQLETFLLRGGDTQQKNLAISVAHLPATGLNGDADYFLRMSRTDLYTKHQLQVGLGAVTVWSRLPNDDNQVEDTVFLTHDNLVATIALSQLGGDDSTLMTDLNDLLRSFSWK